MNKNEKAELIKAQVNQMFHLCEQKSDTGEVTYLDIIRISDYVKEQFKESSVPNEIEGALRVAVGMLHPKKLEATRSIKQGFGLLLGAGGGIGSVIGVLNVLVFGITSTAVTGALWWKTSTVSIIWGGPVGVVLGVGTLAAGVFIVSKKSNMKERIATALSIIHKGIDTWSKNEVTISLPEIRWINKLSDQEYVALLSLVWMLINADEKFSSEEAQLIEAIFKIRSPSEQDLVTGLVELDVDDASEMLRGSAYVHECIKLLLLVPEVDNDFADEEKEVIDRIQIGLA